MPALADPADTPPFRAQPQSFSSRYWITRVLTDPPADGPVIVAFGDPSLVTVFGF